MKAQDHPEHPHEQAKLQDTLKALAARMESLAQANLTTAYDNAAESLLMQYRAEYRALKNVTSSPYFARIDFAPGDRQQPETHYIGKKGFEHEQDAVIDWRAPLAALFYKGKPGEVSYASPIGPIHGWIQLKRNLDIKEQALLTIADEFDLREARPDAHVRVEPGEFLREKLAGRRDPYLQEIIATIQAHQYDLIQASARQVLVVQGVAGSGKTSVALHRLAYLLHPGNAENIEARRCIVFGPNRLFLSYIALVLPDLDIGQVTQTTFVDWACEPLKIDPRRVVDHALEAILAPETSAEERAAHYRRSQLRNSDGMKQLLERYIERRRQPAVPDSGLAYWGIGQLKLDVRLPLAAIAEEHSRFSGLPISQHRARLIEAMKARLARAYDDAIGRKLDEMSEDSRQVAAQAAQLREEAAQLQRLAILARGLSDARLKEQNTAQSLDQGATGLTELADHYQRQADVSLSRVRRTHDEVYDDANWRPAIAQLEAQLAAHFDRFWPPFDAAQDYRALVANRRLLAELGEGVFTPDEIALLHQPRAPESDEIDLNDLAAIHYLHTLAEGVTPVYDHIVIDEAQDASRLQLEIVRRFSRNGSLTILGDLPQSIYTHRGIANWDEARAVFADLPYGYYEITKSYRTTFEIADFANIVLKSLASIGRGAGLAEPFERHGEPVHLHPLSGESESPQAIAAAVRQARAGGHDNIAIIAKTVDAAVSLAVPLYDLLDTFQVIETAETEYRGGLAILPVHLAKGMEFEAALVVGADERTYSATEYDGRLLYVAITRALHVLHVFWIGNVTPHLRDTHQPD